MPTVQELAELVRRVGSRLEREPRTREELLDMATILMFIAHWLDRALSVYTPESGTTPVECERARGLLAVMRDSLSWVQARRDTASVDDVHSRLMLALGSASQLLDTLESMSDNSGSLSPET